MWLPHGAQAKSLGTGRSIEEIARASGWRVRIVPKLTVADGIDAVRTLFRTMWFDRGKCADGLQALRFYRYDVDLNTGQFSRNPLHESSDGPDALRYVAVAGQAARRASYQEPTPRPPTLYEPGARRGMGWMR